jgi:ribose-phosphate pyrophosphokinase
MRDTADVIVVGNVSEDPFAIDVGHAFGQVADPSDHISLKSFANGEVCPRFISDEHDFDHIGEKLVGKTVVIVSTTSAGHSRQAQAMRNMLIARGAKDNGAEHVVLVEPDLFYSAQDRGPRPEHGRTAFPRDVKDRKKFDGQPFSAQLYADLLYTAGVDRVVTVHNHSSAVQHLFSERFDGRFHNLLPSELYAHYLKNSDIVDTNGDGHGLVLCAPDKGAADFTAQMHAALGLPEAGLCIMSKERTGERQVEIRVSPDSPTPLSAIAGRDVIVFDDMVRTGSTIVKCCQSLRKGNPRRILFCVSHFYSSEEARENMACQAIDEILTLNTLPTILNRDTQGRLRRKLVVLKIERWIARFLRVQLGLDAPGEVVRYRVDMSSKNPRWVAPSF